MLAVAGCAPSGVQVSPTGRPESPDSRYAAYYQQQVTWHACQQGAECATVHVPLDWNAPDGDRISLAVIRHRATGHRQGSLFMNPGGPGEAAVDYVGKTQYRDYFFGSALQADYDLVTFDPRGVGRSTPAVTCLDSAQMDDFLYGLPQSAPGTAAYIAESTAHLAAFGQACQRSTGALLAHMDSMSTVRDLDVLRAVVGDQRLNYLGYSYGTKLGALYAQTFPGNVGRMVLDGAVDPSLGNLDTILGQVGGFDRATRSYLHWCLRQSTCPFSGSVTAAASQLHDLLAARQDDPLPLADGRSLGTGAAVTGVTQAMYSSDLWSQLSAALTQLKHGDGTALMALADSYNSRAADGTYTDNTTEAFYATSCLDAPVENANTPQYQAKLRAASSVFGDFWADGTSMCQGWPLSATAKPAAVHAVGAAPIMVVGTTGDPATPYAWARALAGQLQHGFLVTNVGDGHTAYNTNANRCLRGAVERFLTRGTKPATGLRCS